MENPPPNYSSRMVYVVATCNAAALLILCIALAYGRNVDGDEGLYLEVARLVGQGKRLYIDFFYQQMPLIPYFYAAWGKVFGLSLESGRVLSALLTASSGILALFYIAKSTRNIFIVNVCAILLYANGIFLAWAPVIKTHPFNALFLTGFCLSLLSWRRAKCQTGSLLLLAGFLLGLGIGCRLTLAPFSVLGLLYIAIIAPQRRWVAMGCFILGLLLGSLPALYYLAIAPVLFVKYNLFFHTRIFPGIASDDFRMNIAAKVLLEPQFFLLLLALYAGLLLKGLKGSRDLLASDQFFTFLVLLFYFAIHLSAATPFTQYFSTIVPLLVVAVVPVLELMLRWNPAVRTLVLAPVLMFYVAFATPAMRQEMYSVGTLNPEWRLANVRAAAVAIGKIVKPGETCLTWWPGYAALGGCESVPGMENHMREHAILRGIGKAKLNEYKMLSGEELILALESGRYRVVIDGAYRLSTPYNEYAEYLLRENYALRLTRGMAKIYTLKGPGDRLGNRYFEKMEASGEPLVSQLKQRGSR